MSPSGRPPLLPRETERLARTISALPPDAHAGLEIGFLDLRLTRLLRAKLNLVSIDLPHPLPEGFEQYCLAFADIRQLPFADRAFEVVVCTEVLEHLPAPVLQAGVRELLRVSKRHVLVTVPFKQRVWNELFRCDRCQFVGNNMGHLRYLDEEQLEALFPGTRAIKREFISELPGYAPDWLYRLAQRYGNVFHGHTSGRCPACNATASTTTPNLLGWILLRIIWRLESRAPPKPAWLLVLFERDAPNRG